MVKASAKSGHPTFALVRESTASDPAKATLIQSFKKSGVSLLYGDLYDHESLVKAIKQIDVVISTVGHGQLADQVKIIAAIKEAGNVKILETMWIVSMLLNLQRPHSQLRLKSAVLSRLKGSLTLMSPATASPAVFSLHWHSLGSQLLPETKWLYWGMEIPREDDIGTYTIKAVDDPRTLNMILYLRPPGNIYSFNEVVSLWEKKIGKTLEKTYVLEEELLKNIREAPTPINLRLSISHSVFVKRDHANFKIEPSFGVEASELYPDVKYTTVDEYPNNFV